MRAERLLAVWAAETFAMREATKCSLYRNEVAEAAARAVLAAVHRFEAGGRPRPICEEPAARGHWRAALAPLLQARRQQRASDEAVKPLAAYRDEELARMRRNFYGFDPSYHIARSNFVHRVAPSWTPRHLATHRRSGASAQPNVSTTDASQGPVLAASRKSP